MSSMIRSIQKAMLKKRGYIRQTQKVEIVNGVPRIVQLKKGEGCIIGPDQQSVGKHWPRSLPRDEPMTDKQTPRKGAPRGSRRGTHKRPFRQALYAFT